MLRVCKTPQQSRCNRQSNLAQSEVLRKRPKRTGQHHECMIASDNAIAVNCVNGLLVLGEGPCLRDYGSQRSWWSLSLLCWHLDARCKRLCGRMDSIGGFVARPRGKQCQRVHQAIVEQGQLDLVHVQADEIRVKAAAWWHGWDWCSWSRRVCGWVGS